MVVSSSALAAVKADINNSQAQAQANAEQQLSSDFVQAIQALALLKQLRQEDKDTDAVLNQLTELKSDIESLNVQVMDNFDQLEQQLAQKELSDRIHQRHQTMVRHGCRPSYDQNSLPPIFILLQQHFLVTLFSLYNFPRVSPNLYQTVHSALNYVPLEHPDHLLYPNAYQHTSFVE